MSAITEGITYRDVSVTYPDGTDALAGVSLVIEPGEVVVVTGPSGSGKSTLLRAANGIVPHSTGGRLAGEVVVFGRSTRLHPPRELADVVGFVHQDPEAQFVVDRVEADIAFVLENLGAHSTAMRRRVEEVLDALGIAHLRDRRPDTLSGGERQRCAIAGALAAAPAALVLDEPTSQLDPQGADDLLAALTRLNADLGTTVVLAEHRLERAAPLADRALVVEQGRIVADGAPHRVLSGYAGAPAVTRLGRLLGWQPPPLTVREARTHARANGLPPPGSVADGVSTVGEPLLRTRGIAARLGGRVVLDGVDVDVREGEITVLMGRNGSGKTTLLRVLARLLQPAGGELRGDAPTAYVPQDPNSLLFAPTVRGELVHTLELLDRAVDRGVDQMLARFGLAELAERHPRSLSGGERQRVAIAAVAVGGARVLLLDEPTRGMDAASREALEAALEDHVRAGGAAVVATHDVELAARLADHAIVLGDGDVVADGPARRVLTGSLFAPQVARVAPPFLTVEDVAEALEA